MSITEFILSPFLFIIEQLFLFSYRLTGNYGWAIMLLSFGISLLLLPVFIFIEKAKKKDDAIKRKMQSRIDEIKRVYKGQERYYYLKTLNRQYNYSPLKALIPVLSLIIQIPFFIAAYQYLEHFEPLTGVKFGFINDLSQPDGLLGPIHFLPIAMTIVNLITAWFYTRNGDGSERKQMLVVAGIFLVLLFNLPSGLVLYWTMNNVFSFFRLFVTNPEVFKKPATFNIKENFSATNLKSGIESLIPAPKSFFILLLILLTSTQLNWALNNSFDLFIGRIAIAVALTYTFTFLVRVIISRQTIINSKVVNSIQCAVISNKQRFDFKIRCFHKGYLVSLIILLIASIYSQLNWAILKSNFTTLVPRLFAAIAGSWMLVLLIANFARTIYQNKELNFKAFKSYLKLNIKNLIVSFLIILLFGVGTQINWAFHHSFDDLSTRIILIPILSIITIGLSATLIFLLNSFNINVAKLIQKPQLTWYLFFLSVYFLLAAKYYYSDKNQSLILITFVAIIISQIIAFISFYKTDKTAIRLSKKAVLIVVIPFLIIQLISFTSVLLNQNLLSHLLNMQISFIKGSLWEALWAGLIVTFILIVVRKSEDLFRIKDPGKAWLTFILAILFIVGFIFLWNPLEVYSSYPDNFDFPAIDILGHNIKLFLLSLAIPVFLFLLTPKKFKHVWLLLTLIAVSIGLIHNTLFPIDMGTLQEGKYINQSNLAQPLTIYFLESAFIVLAITFFKWILKKGFLRPVNYALIIINAVLILKSLIVTINTGSFIYKIEIETEDYCSIGFSKTEQNVVFVIHDMFHGWYVDSIIKEEPQLKKDLEGFVWYPNTVSNSRLTISSIGAIWGGYDYTIDKLNQDTEHTMTEKLTNISEQFYNKVKSKGFKFTSHRMIYSKIDKNKFDTYVPYWHNDWNKWNSKLKIGMPKEVSFEMLWKNAAFYSSPMFLKAKIYNQGKWVQGDVEKNENTGRAKMYNSLRVLPYISNTYEGTPNFINFHFEASHQPWDIIDENGKMIYDVSPYENNKWTLLEFAKWIKWMKENDVYDNTKIVVISDHGTHWWHYGSVDKNIPLIPNPDIDAEEDFSMNLYALMLVKDFGSKGELKTDWRFMNNADATSILFDENDPTKIEPPLSRTLPSTFALWDREQWTLTKLRIRYQFEVTDDAYDLTKWKRIK